MSNPQHDPAVTPTAAQQQFNAAFQLHENGDLAAAEVLYQAVLAVEPHHPRALYLLGTLESQHGDYVNAHQHLRAAYAVCPDCPEVLNNLGLTLCGLSRHHEAEPMFLRAIALRPEYSNAFNNLAGVIDERGQVEEAAALYRRALELKPDYVDAHNNLGLLLKQLHRLEEAAHSFERALALAPDHYDASNNLGVILKMLDRVVEAEHWLRHALKLRPNSFNALNNLAAVLQAQDRLDEALAEYDQAARLSPDDVLIKWNRSFILLALTRFQEGWEAYEWRRQVFNWQPLPFPEWDGGSLAGKTLLVFAEQGLGDELLFASLFPDLLALAQHCIFECDPRLAPLYWRSFPGATIMSVKRSDRSWLQTLPHIDVQIPAGSMMRYLRPTLESFPARPAYLRADASARAQWRTRLAALGAGLLVGITWRSAITREGRHRNYSRLNDWGAVFALPGIHFISLQYDDCQEELTAVRALFGVEVQVFPELDLFNDLDGTAALIAALDLVIAAGNATGEIAAAQGLPVWRLEPSGRVWTSLGTDAFPWHPRMQVFRQKTAGDWSEVLARVATSLANLPVPSHVVEASENALSHDVAVNHDHNATLDPHANALAALDHGNQAWHAGQVRAAEDYYRHALTLVPHLAEAHNNLGSVLCANDQLADAERSYRAALAYREEFPQAHYNLANVLYQSQRRAEALVEYRVALAQQPDYADAYNNLGRTLQEMGQLEAAADAFAHTLALAPNLPEAHNNLGTLHYHQGHVEAALASYRQALTIQPNFAVALYNLANVLRELGRMTEALPAARQAVELAPTDAKALLILGDVLQDLNRFTEALPCYDRVLAMVGVNRAVLDDTFGEALRNRAFTLLAAGDLTRGWEAYTARAALLKPLPLTCPLFSSIDAPLTGKTILVLPEQGLGDEFLFASCLPDLIAALGPHGHCLVECDPRLMSLYTRSFPSATIRPTDFYAQASNALEVLPDWQIRIGDLPRYWRQRVEQFAADKTSYLIPDPIRVAAWRERLALLGDGRKVGITWRSGLLHAARRRHYSELSQWAPLWALPGVIFVNLQYDTLSPEELAIFATQPEKLHIFSEVNLKDDLEEAAALAAALDLVIGAGNAATELAATVGAPVWRLEAHGRSWTSLGTAMMPWHPQVRLFKQPHWGDWSSVFTILAAQLAKLIAGEAYEEPAAMAADLRAAPSAEEAPRTAVYHGQLAGVLVKAGRIEEAETAYRTALQLDPAWSQAHNDLGNLLRASGRRAEAEHCYLSALRYKPDLVEAHNNLGTLLEQQGRHTEAEAAYRAALRLRPHFPEGWYNLGNCLSDDARWSEAEAAYREALALRPDYALAWFYLGLTLLRLQQPGAAEDAYRQALTAHPGWEEVQNALANLLSAEKRWDEAEALYRAALASTPRPELYSNLGNCLQAQGQATAAETAYREALRLAPDFAPAWNNLGNTLRALGRAAEGLAAFREALQLDPDFADAHSNLATALRETNALVDAEAHDRQAVALDPQLAGAWVNLGNTLEHTGRLPEAEECFQRALVLGWEDAVVPLAKVLYEQGQIEAALAALEDAIRRYPDDPELRWNLSLPLLACGNLELGWAAYEWGRYLPPGQGRRRHPALALPEWDGQISYLAEKTILVRAEQGVGDEILFASCLPDLLAIAKHVIIECDPRLAVLYARSFPNATIVGVTRDQQQWLTAIDPVDLQIPLGSLPRFFRRDLSAFPTRTNYLLPDPVRCNELRTRMVGTGLRVGITWRSQLATANRARYYSALADWQTLLSVPGVVFVNLQYDALAPEELAILSAHHVVVISALDLLTDLDGAAALAASLDLVIAVGNAAEELAAAVGVPVWRIEPFGRPWTSLGTDAFPWHPRTKIFRQTTTGAWHEVLARITTALIEESAKPGAPPNPKLLLDQGRHLQEQNKLDAAAACCEEVLRFDATCAEAYNDLGNIRLKQGDLTAAEACYHQALSLWPEYVETWNNLGSLLGKKKLIKEALTCYQTALDLRPELFEARYNLASLLQDEGDPVAAEKHFRYALNNGVDNALLWNGLALAVRDQGRIDEALNCFAEAQRHAPNDARIRWNVGLTYLARGDLVQGWDGFEWGYRTMGRCSREFTFPEWDGRIILDGTLLIYAEQGIGDEIIFASCLPDLFPLVGCCVIECDPRLSTLFQRSFPQAEIRGVMRKDREWLTEIGAVDFQCPIGSLSYYLRRHLDSFPHRPGYLLPDPIQRIAWRKRLTALDHNADQPQSHKKTLKVGISWRSRLVGSGRARFYSRLTQWGELFAVAGVTLVNLQYDDCTAELAEVATQFGVKIVQFADLDLLNDLDGIAALASALDLVIAPPNAVAELAAAVGTEVWRLDAALPNWLGLGTDYMPWHPTMRLFRQEQLGDWTGILKTMTATLAQRATQVMLDPWIEHLPLQISHHERKDLAGQTAQILAGLVNPGTVVLQIGVGEIAITHALATVVGEKGMVLVYEERPGPFRRLQAFLLRNGLSQVRYRPEQIGAHDGELPAWRACPWDLLVSADPKLDLAWATAPVPCRTVDSLELHACYLLAMDAEGRETDILAGAWRTIARCQPLLSLGRYRYDATAGLITILEAHGYRAVAQNIGAGDMILLAYPLT